MADLEEPTKQDAAATTEEAGGLDDDDGETELTLQSGGDAESQSFKVTKQQAKLSKFVTTVLEGRNSHFIYLFFFIFFFLSFFWCCGFCSVLQKKTTKKIKINETNKTNKTKKTKKTNRTLFCK